jgi:hypothetical protein
VPKNELQDHECSFCGELKNRAMQTMGPKHSGQEQKWVLSARCTEGQEKSKYEDFSPSRMCSDQLASDSKNEVLDRNTSSLGPAAST